LCSPHLSSTGLFASILGLFIIAFTKAGNWLIGESVNRVIGELVNRLIG